MINCSNVYTQILKRKNIDISMTEENHYYENAVAERVNGILKDEFYLDHTFDSHNTQSGPQKMPLIYTMK
ncbi:hypothetical protein [Salegentibacter maritimus]|uniref:hypothetical protein n=1 Tax=Salegentibacter maritimus TaxID=2794347 RepID=UPI0018E47239|nr:hypothetical protein [Salegentibacter maritimus]MBI6118234.1 hypothetical protein [Salegentibacter maritimus]